MKAKRTPNREDIIAVAAFFRDVLQDSYSKNDRDWLVGHPMLVHVVLDDEVGVLRGIFVDDNYYTNGKVDWKRMVECVTGELGRTLVKPSSDQEWADVVVVLNSGYAPDFSALLFEMHTVDQRYVAGVGLCVIEGVRRLDPKARLEIAEVDREWGEPNYHFLTAKQEL